MEAWRRRFSAGTLAHRAARLYRAGNPMKVNSMPQYFFDTRDDDKVVCDHEGLELPDVQAATKVAARSLAELALEVLPSSTARCLGVDVRDDRQREVLTTELTYKALLHPVTPDPA